MNIQSVVIKKSLLLWVLLIPLAILNGGLREKVLTPWLGLDYSLPLSGLLLILMIFLLCYVGIPRLGKASAFTYIMMGLCWMLLTILFEFVLGLFMGNTFVKLLYAYNITTGNLWLLVVLFIGIAPYLVMKLQRRI